MKKPACPNCGSSDVFAAIDVKWNGERWGLNQTRLADDSTEIDCMDCDHRALLEDGNFPDPCEQIEKGALNGAMIRTKLRSEFVKQIAVMQKSTEGLHGDPFHVTLDRLIDRAREINATAAKDEVL